MQEYHNRIRELREEKTYNTGKIKHRAWSCPGNNKCIRTRKASSKCLISYEIKQYIRCKHGLHNDEI